MTRRRSALAVAVLLTCLAAVAVILTGCSGAPAPRAVAVPVTSAAPTAAPSLGPTATATQTPTATPTPTRTPTATPTQPPTQTPTPTPTPSAAAATTASAVSHDEVAPAVPTRFEMAGPAFDIRANVCGMANVRPLDPPGDQYHTVCWVREGFGVAPGTHSGGTSYVLGHSWAEANLVLNPLSTYVMPEVDLKHPVSQNGIATYPITRVNGYRVVLTTANGTLTYVVTDAYTVAKNQAGYVRSLMNERDPDRVVLITCGVLNGRDVDQNVIVEARLASSVKA